MSVHNTVSWNAECVLCMKLPLPCTTWHAFTKFRNDLLVSKIKSRAVFPRDGLRPSRWKKHEDYTFHHHEIFFSHHRRLVCWGVGQTIRVFPASIVVLSSWFIFKDWIVRKTVWLNKKLMIRSNFIMMLYLNPFFFGVCDPNPDSLSGLSIYIYVIPRKWFDVAGSVF